ncbi:hypothetical protein GGR50DRAFT_659276 [Xylaria sp. CBS 124048]|nr:hypothetical protein GGR50DRAFT_659276 [Xylaria sp. CBS 124048]
MAASKTSPQRKPTRFQPRRAVRDAPAINAAAAAPATTATATPKKRNPPRPRADSARVVKNPPSPQKGRPAQRQRKKLQQALVRKVDGRDPDDAWREQANLLGLPLSSPPPPPPPAMMGGKGKGKAPQNDQEDHHAGGVPNGHRVDDNEVRRAECWIPNFEHRGRVRTRPAGISHCVYPYLAMLGQSSYGRQILRFGRYHFRC